MFLIYPMSTVLPMVPAVARVEAGASAYVRRVGGGHSGVLAVVLTSHLVCRPTTARCPYCTLPTAKRHLIAILPCPTCFAHCVLSCCIYAQ